MWEKGSRIVSSPCIVWMEFQCRVQPRLGLFTSLHTNQCQHYYTLGKLLPKGALGSHGSNHSWLFQVSCVFSPLALAPVFLLRFLKEHMTGNLRLLSFVVPCWMVLLGFSLLSTCWNTVLITFPIVKDLVRNVPVSKVLKCLPTLF